MDPVVRALQKALQSRIDGLREVTTARVEPRDLYRRGDFTFLQVEVCRDHLSLDVWLPEALREEARSSGIARAHPFLGQEAVVIRFERAQDLARVARWIEASHDWAPVRDQAPRPSQVPQALIPSLEERLIKANSNRPSAAPPPVEAPSDTRPTEPPSPVTPPARPAEAAPAPRPRTAAKKPAPKAKAGDEKAAPTRKAAPKKAPKKAAAKKAATKKAPAKKASTGRATRRA